MNPKYRHTLLLSLFVLLPILSLSAQEIVLSGGAVGDDVGYRSVVELERIILNDREWMNDANRLMNELYVLDVRMHTLLSNSGGEDSRRKLVQERNNIRRLIVDLTEARNNVYNRLIRMREEQNHLELRPGIGQ